MLTIQAWLQAQNQHQNSNKHFSNNDMLLLLEQLLSQNRAWLFTHSDFQLNTSQVNQLNDWSQALSTGQPLAYIMGEQAFWDLKLKVNQHTLIPRPDTEILIETVIELMADYKPKRILDLGTGSGALALVLAQIYPNAEVLAIDQSKQALVVANENAIKNNIHNIEFQQSNWFANLAEQQFDLIVSNPPYIAIDDIHLKDLQHEPIEALVADQNGLGDFNRICSEAINFLVEGGLLLFEHGWQQQQPVQSKMIDAGFKNCNSRKDLAGHKRVTFGYK